MENYNRLFLLEEPGFDMDKWSKEDYESDKAMPKGNIQATQLNAAYFGQPKLNADILQHFDVPAKQANGEWIKDGSFADLLKAVYEGDNDVKDASADAASEHKSESSDVRIEDIIATMQLTHVPTIAGDLELVDLVPYVKSASSSKSYESTQVGDKNQTEFGFDVAFSSDKQDLMVMRNGVIVDRENYAIIELEGGEGVAIKMTEADGSDADAPVEGEVFALYATKEVIELDVIDTFIAEQREILKKAQEASEELKASNETILDKLNTEKADAEAELARATAELEKASEEVSENLDALSVADSMDKVASLKTALAELRKETSNGLESKRNSAFAVENGNKDITASNNVISENATRMAAFIETIETIIDKAETEKQSQEELAKAIKKASDFAA